MRGSARPSSGDGPATRCCDATPRDVRDDATDPALAAAAAVVIPLIGVELARTAARAPAMGGTASKVGAIMRLSCRLAPLSVRPSGVPSPSTTRCRFVPDLPRSVGLGPVSAPPLWRTGRRCRAKPGSSPAGRRGAIAATASDAGPARPGPRATRPAGASRSCRCSPSRRARRATGSRFAARTGCPPAPPGPARADVRPSTSVARTATRARSPSRDRREQEALPLPLNTQNPVLSPVLSRTHSLSIRGGCGIRLGGSDQAVRRWWPAVAVFRP